MRSNQPRSDGRLTAAQRVAAIIDLMLVGAYVDGQTPRQLAAEWDFSTSAIEKNAAEASRYLRRACGNPEDLKARLLAQLQNIVGQALEQRQPRSAVAAIHEMASILGLHKLALTGPDGTPLVPGVVVLPPEDEPPTS